METVSKMSKSVRWKRQLYTPIVGAKRPREARVNKAPLGVEDEIDYNILASSMKEISFCLKITKAHESYVDFSMLMVENNGVCRSADEFHDKAENVGSVSCNRIHLYSAFHITSALAFMQGCHLKGQLATSSLWVPRRHSSLSITIRSIRFSERRYSSVL
jgi:hypothetical protein